ncbi:MAG TPA: hypothetical protein VIJ42_09060, partial [Stellaceae bacterium]
FEVNRAAKDRPKAEAPQGPTLVPAEITTARPAPSSAQDVFGELATPKPREEEKIDVDAVFGKLKELKKVE